MAGDSVKLPYGSSEGELGTLEPLAINFENTVIYAIAILGFWCGLTWNPPARWRGG